MAEMENWPISKFVVYKDNPRKNDHAVGKAAAAIQEFGFRVPIIAKSDGSVIDGHLRLKAAHRLGIKSVPVIIADDLTDDQIKAFRISVNKIADLADWDDALLKIGLNELDGLNFDLDTIGFGDVELKTILDDEEKIREKHVKFGDMKRTYILISIPNGEEIEGMDDVIKQVMDVGGDVDYGGN